MSVTKRLVRLYPDPFREHWGTGLEAEAQDGGWRSWPNLLIGVLDMWLHPTVWPARSPAQRRGRAAVLAIAVALAGWLAEHAAAEQHSLHLPGLLRIGEMNLDVFDAVTLLGLALVAPRPRLSFGAAAAMLRQAVRRLAVPVLLGAGVVVTVHAGVGTSVPLALRLGVLGCWWIALALGAVQLCQVVAGFGADLTVPPHRGRLRLGVGILAGMFILTGAVVLGTSMVRGVPDTLSVATGAGLLVLASVCGWTLRDLRQLPATG
ncbi:hypothetical protein FNH05_03475 [Amycolatopsis rhizosphaerae]|uniref:Uncharacterized protein n=1 Tax=Amycolatopsis rhizosphaerae TaxID=2053003 RepID=A0A558DJF5_9PSEU|nr:hypothetical protein [Amycolatopsis rhizosphaerae]TVT61148.1 hypothetical protein FNH05_03475 [Amycolatopsis rhizosphaerae]